MYTEDTVFFPLFIRIWAGVPSDIALIYSHNSVESEIQLPLLALTATAVDSRVYQ